jgi:hypothetical protein
VRRALLIACLILCTREAEAQGFPPSPVRPETPPVSADYPEQFRFAPPKIYEKWWREIAECHDLVFPPELAVKVRFFAVNAETMMIGDHGQALAFSPPWLATIYVVLPHVYTESIIKHEFLHQLLTWNGIDQGRDWHPAKYFEHCGIRTTYP